MDWACYKSLCDRPDVLSRWMIERVLALLAAEGRALRSGASDGLLAGALRGVLATDPLPKPTGHRGPAAADMFVARLDPLLVETLCRRIERAAAAGSLAAMAQIRSPMAFQIAWREFASFVAQGSAKPTVIC